MTSNSRETVAVIMAAGKGTRMKSELPKVLHPLMGTPMVMHVVNACKDAGIRRIIIVIGNCAELVRETLGNDFEYVEQKEQLGTGHALMMAAPPLKDFTGDVLVLAGDTPFLTGEILKELVDKHQTSNAPATMLTALIDPPLSYGRIIRNDSGNILRITEARDATEEELEIKEVNTSHYCFQAERVFPLLDNLSTDNDQGEYYLTDVISMLVEGNEIVESITSEDPDILLGVNNRIHLSECVSIYRKKIVDKLMMDGVTILDPESVYIEPQVKIGRDTTIYPFTTLTGKTTIGEGCTIGPQVRMGNVKIEDNVRIEFSVIEDRTIEKDERIGPFAYISKR